MKSIKINKIINGLIDSIASFNQYIPDTSQQIIIRFVNPATIIENSIEYSIIYVKPLRQQ
jgi:hypothetical protein